MLLTFLHCFPDSLAIFYSHANKAIWNCNWIGMRDRKSARDLTSPLPREALTSPHQSHYQPLPHHFLSLSPPLIILLSPSPSHTRIHVQKPSPAFRPTQNTKHTYPDTHPHDRQTGTLSLSFSSDAVCRGRSLWLWSHSGDDPPSSIIHLLQALWPLSPAATSLLLS